ncbi:hypothetical protein BCR41DRAFT_357043 [Lobosporangium transversale]|uniref:Defect at low temperature protein 1 n=1 Tax=Lobosporangium transversale TaxID=64571 RepID=A0A1Y2GHS3_9FUNG|nr:hypothetical protein BCR41DRAFT_357043 [Lobosporangium transversale]ORZ11330.1 hypothetical protein BCR41DRAFT_357043 [Lobosporangium transversale]|eukprot:XP_021879645.1 hypothetical protein BCR41DRAFT_357043 [Lobosporangium transversale]
MPITKEDLPMSVYEFVQSELDRVARLAKKAVPLLEESGQPGWGKPGSSLQGTHFKTFMASTPHFIERAAIAQSPDLARPPNMSISAYIHMLIDLKLVTRDIGLEYIAGYEQARFGGVRNDPLPVTMSPLHNQQQLHHRHAQQASVRSNRQSSSVVNPRHPYQDPSTISAMTAEGMQSPISRDVGTEGVEEEDYIRFMKVLSWILQELGWDDDVEEAYEEENRERERVQQQDIAGGEASQIERSAWSKSGDLEDIVMSRVSVNGRQAASMGSRTDKSHQNRDSQLSGESFIVVDESEIPTHTYSSGKRGEGSGGVGGRVVYAIDATDSSSKGKKRQTKSGNMSTRSLLTMRTMQTASSTRS